MASWKDMKTPEEIAAEEKARQNEQAERIRLSAREIAARLQSDVGELQKKLAQWSGQQTTLQPKGSSARVFLHDDEHGAQCHREIRAGVAVRHGKHVDLVQMLRVREHAMDAAAKSVGEVRGIEEREGCDGSGHRAMRG